ncbi:and PDZ domain-containing 4 [Octopus vulgaris]|uniref:And PDZ domain-containing 4 n=1 Tax=Octopus vulgaris TaxID=6645 RepID=A0AA36AQA6_OCTVU|nr:and PDZ domain-containing 4 [Octopus vulgaris]
MDKQHEINHLSQVTSWIPPRDNWYPKNGLPYGWEEALDKNDKPYYINVSTVNFWGEVNTFCDIVVV